MIKIINFHDVRNSAWFEKTVKILKRRYELISIKDLEDFYYNGKTSKNACHITIDDGDMTFYDIIYPVLKKHNIPATLFVSPKICSNSENFWFQEIRGFDDYEVKKIVSEYFNIKMDVLSQFAPEIILKQFNIEDIWGIIFKYKERFQINDMEPQNMTIAQIKEVDNYGLVAIGAHTLNHPFLANENDIVSEMEIVDSINELQSMLGHEIKYFAYPNGIPIFDFGQREIDILKNNNCKLAFSTNAKNFTLEDNPLAIPRFGLSYGNNIFIIVKLFLGQNWGKLKNLKSKGERKLRIELKNRLKNKQ